MLIGLPSIISRGSGGGGGGRNASSDFMLQGLDMYQPDGLEKELSFS